MIAKHLKWTRQSNEQEKKKKNNEHHDELEEREREDDMSNTTEHKPRECAQVGVNEVNASNSPINI